MGEQYSHLIQMLAGCFHQDWLLEAKNADEVLRRYVSDATGAVRKAVVSDINELLREPNRDVDEFVETSGCYYVPSVEGMSTRQWLAKISSVLDPKRVVTHE